MNQETNSTECKHRELKYCHDCYAYKCKKYGLSVFTCKLGGDDLVK